MNAAPLLGSPRALAVAANMASLHAVRSQRDLASQMACELARVLPDTAFALCLFGGGREQRRVEAVGGACPWTAGTDVEVGGWQPEQRHVLPMRHEERQLGELVVGRGLDGGEEALAAAMLSHYCVALVNLTLNEEARQATNHYCASLQALEEGIVLFQEEDSEAVLARLLSLAASMMQAQAGALYVLREIGNADSGLDLAQALGIPDTMLLGFRRVDGGEWPDPTLGQVPAIFRRGDDAAELAGLDLGSIPPILQDVVLVPLRYHGIEAGVVALFNSGIDAEHAGDHLHRIESLSQLGAALLHRLQLEAIAVRNQAIARELQIAETIQRRLIPTDPPATREYDFAWCSIAAQHIGGDYLDLLTADLGDIYAVVADVSGHGINSALLMSSFRAAYRGDAPWLEPCDLAAALNGQVVNEVGATGMFITAALMRIERGSRLTTVTSAGHNPILHYRAATRTVVTVESHGPPLGFTEGATYEQESFTLGCGDILLLYTDGVTEAADAEMDMFGEDRLQALLLEHAGATPTKLVETIQGEVARFTGRDRCDDDVSILVVKAMDPKAV